MRFFDLFAGIGGFRLGLERASSDFKCAGSGEIDKYARQIYSRHWEEPEFADITKVDAREIPEHDILCAGFPCQAFSLAGKRLGFEDTRGTLFFEIVRIARQKRPRLLFLENVKGLLYHDRGKTFATILATLDGLGYDAEWQVLNSKYWVPQNRERVFIIGYLREQPTPKIFPIGENGKMDNTARNEDRQTIQCLEATQYKGVSSERFYGIAMPVLCADREQGRQNGRKIKMHNEPMFTLTGMDRHGIYNGERIRRLTPLECERLQGFPDDWTEGISDSQRYKVLGNAVTVPVIEFIAKYIIKSLSTN